MQLLAHGHVPPVWPRTLVGRWEARLGDFALARLGLASAWSRLQQQLPGGSAPQGGEEWQCPPSPPEGFALFVSPTWMQKTRSWLPFGPVSRGRVWEEGAMQRRWRDPPHPPPGAVLWEAAAGVGSPAASRGFCFSPAPTLSFRNMKGQSLARVFHCGFDGRGPPRSVPGRAAFGTGWSAEGTHGMLPLPSAVTQAAGACLAGLGPRGLPAPGSIFRKPGEVGAARHSKKFLVRFVVSRLR